MTNRFKMPREPLRHLTLVALSALLVMQLVQPDRSPSRALPGAAMASSLLVSPAVDSLLRRSCYDCHSNSTKYPWYTAIQPIGWWLADHIREGRREINFDEFAAYRPMRQYRKLQDITNEITTDAMPLPSYLIMHEAARLTSKDKQVLLDWVTAAREEMKQKHPADSLVRRR